jgi:hypothetical protein
MSELLTLMKPLNPPKTYIDTAGWKASMFRTVTPGTAMLPAFRLTVVVTDRILS